MVRLGRLEAEVGPELGLGQRVEAVAAVLRLEAGGARPGLGLAGVAVRIGRSRAGWVA